MAAPDPDALKAACEALAARDTVMRAAFDRVGVPAWRARPAAYVTIARTIAGQQISTRAAAAIWARLETLLGAVEAERMLATPDEQLRAVGLSRPKVAHMKSVAAAVGDGRLCFDRLRAASLQTARDELMAVKGIGPWTAEIFCLYAKGALDAFPHNDIGLSEAWKQLSGHEIRAKPKEFAEIGESWAPFRGVATHLLWAWINAGRDARDP
jgi:DNA-3-methyladenine glycosylase II